MDYNYQHTQFVVKTDDGYKVGTVVKQSKFYIHVYYPQLGYKIYGPEYFRKIIEGQLLIEFSGTTPRLIKGDIQVSSTSFDSGEYIYFPRLLKYICKETGIKDQEDNTVEYLQSLLVEYNKNKCTNYEEKLFSY